MSKTLTQRVRRLEKFIETASKDSKYRITLKGETLSTYDYNPENRLEELSERLEGANKLLSKASQENGKLQAALQAQEIDNARLATDLRKVCDKRDQLVVDKKHLTRELEEFEGKVKGSEKVVRKLKGNNPIKGFGGFELVKLGVKRLLKMGGI